MVEHIDHIEGADGSDLYVESTRVNRAAKDLAKEYDLVFLFTSQMNNEAIKGSEIDLRSSGRHSRITSSCARTNATLPRGCSDCIGGFAIKAQRDSH